MDALALGDGMTVLFLLGAVQGVFLAAVLLGRPGATWPARLLAAFVLVFSVDLGMAVYHASGVSLRHPALIGLDLPIALLYGPLLYLYVRTLTASRPGLRRGDLWHAVPFLALAAFLLPVLLRPGPEKLALMRDPSLMVQTRALAVVSPLKIAHGLAYLAWAGVASWRYARRAGPAERARARWLRTLVGGALVLLAGTVVLYALGPRGAVVGMDPAGPFDDLTLLLATVFVYVLGYAALSRPEATEPAGRGAPPEGPGLEAEPEAAYARSGMRAEEAAAHYARLVALMETERPYRRGDLSLQALADQLGISAHNLTEVLNTQAGASFYDVVNGYRVREVQARLADPDYAHWTVLGIGMEAGFNAKSSFNAAFKRHTGTTPSAYRRALSETA